MADLVSQRQLARILGLGRNSGYLTKLKAEGVLKRCYVQEKGRRYPRLDVEIAIEEIEASKDPSKDHVRQRWEAYRAGNQNSHASVSESKGAGCAQPTPGTDAVDVLDGAASQGAGTRHGQASGIVVPEALALNVPEKLSQQSGPGSAISPASGGAGESAAANVVSYQDAKTRKEIMLAKRAELDYEEAAGKLVQKAGVQKAGAAIAIMVREKLSTIPDRLAQVLAAETGPERVHEYLTQEINQICHALAERLEREFDVRPAA